MGNGSGELSAKAWQSITRDVSPVLDSSESSPSSAQPPYTNLEQECQFGFSNQFDVLDGANDGGVRDGNVSEDDLRYVVEHPEEFGGADSEVVEVAAYYLENGEAFDRLDTGAGQGGADDNVSSEDVALVLSGQRPDPMASSQEAGAFAAAQISAIQRAAGWYGIDAEQASSLVSQVLAGTPLRDPDFAIALGESLAQDSNIDPSTFLALLPQIAYSGELPQASVDAMLEALAPAINEALTALAEAAGTGDFQAVPPYEAALASLVDMATMAGDTGNQVIANAIASSYADGADTFSPGEVISNALYLRLFAGGQALGLAALLPGALEAEGHGEAAAGLSGRIADALVASANGPLEHYVQTLEQYNFAMQMRPAFESEEAFQAALDELMTRELGADWERQIEDATAAVAAQGELALEALTLFTGNDAVTNALLADPGTQLVITVALSSNPALITGEQGQMLLDTFAELGISGVSEPPNPLAAVVAQAYLQANVLGPASAPGITPEQRVALIEQAMKENTSLAQLLGLDPTDAQQLEQYNLLIEQMARIPVDENVVVDPTDGVLQLGSAYGNTVDAIDDLGLPESMTHMLGGVALAFGGLQLIDSVGGVWTDPGLQSGLALLINGADLGISGIELLDTIGRLQISETGAVATASRFLAGVGILMTSVDAIDRLSNGDYVGAGLGVVTAGGLVAGLLGSSLGFGVAAVGQLALVIHDLHRASEYRNRFETDAQRDFLAQSMFGPELAAVLYDTSGGSVSPVPLLLNYLEGEGLNLEQSIAYLQYLREFARYDVVLKGLRDHVHHLLDDSNGDPTDFDATELTAYIEGCDPFGQSVMTPTQWLASQG